MSAQWLDAAERSLLAGHFNRAVRDAETVLRNEAGSESTQLSIRAAYVLLQALFELDRLKEVQPQLEKAFGSIAKTPLSVILLWVSLALDEETPATDAAAAALRDALAAAAPAAPGDARSSSPAAEHSLEDLQKGVRMYACEVLAAGRRDPAAATRWLGAYYGSGRQREEAVQRAQDGLRPRSPWHSFATDSKFRQALSREIDSHRTAASQAAGDREIQPAPLASHVAELPAAGILLPDGAPGLALPQNALQNSSSGAGANPLRGEQAAAAALHEREASGLAGAQAAAPNWWELPVDEGPFEWVTGTHAAALAAGAGVLLYACFAERRSISRLLQRGYQAVGGSIAEVARLATSLNPNPMTAALSR